MEGMDNEEEYNELNNDYNLNENMGNMGMRNDIELSEQNLIQNNKTDDIEGLDDLY